MVVVNKINMHLKLPSGELERAAAPLLATATATAAATAANTEINLGPTVDVSQLPAPIDADEPPNEPSRKRPRTSVVNRLVLKSHDNESEKLETNQALLEAAARVNGAVSELMACVDALSDVGGGKNQNQAVRREAVERIRESIVPVLHIASRYLHDTGMSFAPFGGTRSLHLRTEARRRKDVVDVASGRSPALQMIDDFVSHSVVEIPRHLAAESTHETTAGHGGEEGEEMVTIAIPRPKNGMEYSKSEALMAAKMYKKGRDRGKAIRAMVEQGFTPASTKTIYRIIQADEEGHSIVDENWYGPGRPGKFPENYVFKHGPIIPAVGKPSAEDLVEITMPKKKGGKGKTGASADVAREPNEAVENDRKSTAAKPAANGPVKRSATKFSASRAPRKPDAKPTDKVWPDKVVNFPLPEPGEGKTYKKSECVEIAKRYPRGTPLRRTAIEAMLYKGYVPNSIKSVYRLLQRDEKGLPIIDNDWGVVGCPPLLSNDEVDAIIERLKQGDGRIYCRSDVKQILVNAVREKIAKQGRNPDEVTICFSSTSVRNYSSMFKSKLSSVFWKE